MPELSPARHHLAWLAPFAAGTAELAGPCCLAEEAAQELLDRWLRRDRPLIVTRQPAGPAETICLGLALPPADGKYRLAFSVPRQMVRVIRPPPLLADAVAALPIPWRTTIAALLAAPEIAACEPRLYGSAAMQVLTGETSLSESSDLDLLLSPSSWPAAQRAAASLLKLGENLPGPRLDGEIVNPAGFAVAWRELATAPARLLVKSISAVELLATTQFAAEFALSERRVA